MQITATISFLLIGVSLAFTPQKPTLSSSSSLNLSIGETAPDFSLIDQNGKTVSRSSIKKPLVVYFYPGDSSPGCTVQANDFNDRIVDIRKQFGADVVGISGQDVDSKQKFATELGLQFSILADDGDKVRSEFAVPRAAFGLFPGRVTYVLDKSGVCQLVFNDLAKPSAHIDAAVEQLKEMKSSDPPKSPFSSFFGGN